MRLRDKKPPAPPRYSADELVGLAEDGYVQSLLSQEKRKHRNNSTVPDLTNGAGHSS